MTHVCIVLSSKVIYCLRLMQGCNRRFLPKKEKSLCRFFLPQISKIFLFFGLHLPKMQEERKKIFEIFSQICLPQMQKSAKGLHLPQIFLPRKSSEDHFPQICLPQIFLAENLPQIFFRRSSSEGDFPQINLPSKVHLHADQNGRIFGNFFRRFDFFFIFAPSVPQ